MAAEFGQNGYITVSGMVRGIDTAAHRGALPTSTIGVVADGVDMSYPPENAELFDQVAATGLLKAEMPPGTRPTLSHFQIRNRVITSLTLGVVVAEATHRSGLLITAREAAERGSDVMAMPGSPLDPRSDGCNRLIRDGATLAQNAADVIYCISRQTNVDMPLSAPEWTNGVPQTMDQTAVDNVRESLLQDLSFDPVTTDESFDWHLQPAPVAWAAILELEISGLVSQHYGNRVAHISQQ